MLDVPTFSFALASVLTTHIVVVGVSILIPNVTLSVFLPIIQNECYSDCCHRGSPTLICELREYLLTLLFVGRGRNDKLPKIKFEIPIR